MPGLDGLAADLAWQYKREFFKQITLAENVEGGQIVFHGPGEPGANLPRWISVCVSWPDSSKAKRWLSCVASSIFHARLATRSSIGIATWSLGPHDLFHAGHQHALAVLFQRDRQRFAGALVDDPGLRNGYGWKMRSRDVA